VDSPLTLHCPLLPSDCQLSEVTPLCKSFCELRSSVGVDLEDYLTNVDPVTANPPLSVVINVAILAYIISPFYYYLTWALINKKPIKIPAVSIGILYLYILIGISVQVVWGTNPSKEPKLFFLYNFLEFFIAIITIVRGLLDTNEVKQKAS